MGVFTKNKNPEHCGLIFTKKNCFQLTLLSILVTSFTVPWVWTMTNVVHNLVTFFVLHWAKSTPWLSPIEQGSVRRLTHWEQLDHGEQYTPTRTFLTIIPILLFFLASFY